LPFGARLSVVPLRHEQPVGELNRQVLDPVSYRPRFRIACAQVASPLLPYLHSLTEMRMPVIKLTQELISSGLECPENKSHVEYCDVDFPGLYVEIRNTSAGQGIFRYRHKDKNGKTCHEPLGKTSNTSLQEARKKAKQFRAELELGRDRRSEERARDQCPTLSEFFHRM
jgi:hypothetical protein